MEYNLQDELIGENPATAELVGLFEARPEMQQWVGSEAILYHQFPIYRDASTGEPLTAELLLVSPIHGVVLLGTWSEVNEAQETLSEYALRVENLSATLFARLLRDHDLRASPRSLLVPYREAIYVQSDDHEPPQTAVPLLSLAELEHELASPPPSAAEASRLFDELVSAIEGTKGFIPGTSRRESPEAGTKAQAVAMIEGEIRRFDQKQKVGFMHEVAGPQRVRGLAGSGKTVVLAMKAALSLIREPDSTVLFTFHTKSLRQQVRRLITRFYREFDDHDPDWDRMLVMHAWGGKQLEGVYYRACITHDVSPLNYADASRGGGHPFENAIDHFFRHADPVRPLFDVTFVDEAQDLPESFLRLARFLTKDDRFVIAYDEFQSIWEPGPRELSSLLEAGDDRPEIEFSGSGDVVLYKCYRNPREVIFAAHALGLGVFGPRVVQVLENEEHWRDVGYEPQTPVEAGKEVTIRRPAENSPTSLSGLYETSEIVSAHAFDELDDEIGFVCGRIESDIKSDGLLPEDVLVISVDDKWAKGYLSEIAKELRARGIDANDIHSSYDPSPDFRVGGEVTLSTSHKAKGNEAYQVYIVGVDALFKRIYRSDLKSPRGAPSLELAARNTLFVAVTRAKGWVTISGVGDYATCCVEEMKRIYSAFPDLVFEYPSPEEIQILQRDLNEHDARELRLQQLMDEMMKLGLSESEIHARMGASRAESTKE